MLKEFQYLCPHQESFAEKKPIVQTVKDSKWCPEDTENLS